MSVDLEVFKGTVVLEDVLLLLTSFLMKNSLIVSLVLILLVVGWILYLFRDNIKGMYSKSSEGVKEDISHGAKVIKEDISHSVKEIQTDVKN